jgi:hypothetical protein
VGLKTRCHLPQMNLYLARIRVARGRVTFVPRPQINSTRLTTSLGSCRRFPLAMSPLGSSNGPAPLCCISVVLGPEVRTRLRVKTSSSRGLSPLFCEPAPSPTVEEVRVLEFRRSRCWRPLVPTSVIDARPDPKGRSGAA